MERHVRVSAAGGRPIAVRAYLDYLDWNDEPVREETEIIEGHFCWDDEEVQEATLAIVVPQEPGYWAAAVTEFAEVDEIECAQIDEEGCSWWHALLGAEINNPDRGAGIRIGVVDAGFLADPSLDHVTFAPHLEQQRPAPTDFWAHGEVVCRILGDRDAPEACAPIAPGSELIFADATYSRMTCQDEDFVFPFVDGDPSEHLDPRRVGDAIFQLVFDYDVDLINLSLGTFAELPEDLESGVAEAITAAVDAGVTVVCAAGNVFTSGAAFPAMLPDCVGVGAFGLHGWGPEGSVVRETSRPSRKAMGRLGEQTVFHWPESAYDRGVDTLGPGVGILVARDGAPAFDVSGTSFAAPIVTGMLAIELGRDPHYLHMPRDEARSEYARMRLSGLCHRTGMSPSFEGEGIFTLELEGN